MKLYFIYILLFFLSQQASAQPISSDGYWWNELHDWQIGDPGWRNWVVISPGYLGPNALPIPEVKKGFLPTNTEFEIFASNHFHQGDPTQDISGKIYIPFAKNRIAIEMYGVAIEKFAFSEEIRNERFSRIEDGKGIAIGDFYFSTLLKISKDRKFPNTLFRFATKTASGNQLEGARYSDSPAYFLDFSFSKDYSTEGMGLIRPFGLFGFYSWQTNDELNLQNDAYMYALGFDFEKNNWLVSGSWSGYTGYKSLRDKPMRLDFDLRRDFNNRAIRFQYLHGLRDWEYKTIKFSYIWKLNGVE